MNTPADFAEILLQLEQLREDIAFVRALRRLKVITTDAEIPLQFALGGENAIIDLRALSANGATRTAQIPDPTGHAGEVLTTDGETASWASL